MDKQKSLTLDSTLPQLRPDTESAASPHAYSYVFVQIRWRIASDTDDMPKAALNAIIGTKGFTVPPIQRPINHTNSMIS